MEQENPVIKQLSYNDDMPYSDEDAPPRDDEADALIQAARHHRVPEDEENPNDCFSERLL